jgi:hypothetical protein
MNPYLTITLEDNEIITTNFLQTYRHKLQNQSQQQFNSNNFNIIYNHCELAIERTTINIVNNTL